MLIEYSMVHVPQLFLIPLSSTFTYSYHILINFFPSTFQPLPVIKGRCWENAARRSFFSRDNMENFIQFCRRLGVHENLLFESDDLGKEDSPNQS